MLYVGDRVKRPGEINGKSANMNHTVLRKILPGARTAADVPAEHILLVMDCDHMVRPDFFRKTGPVMLDEAVAVAVVPQHFHNVVSPDAFDSGNGEVMYVKQPYRFGAGMCFVTGVEFEPSSCDTDQGAAEEGCESPHSSRLICICTAALAIRFGPPRHSSRLICICP